jgi:hypothetical protein
MTVFRTTEHSDTDPRWDGPTLASLPDLPALLRDPHSEETETWPSHATSVHATTELA